MSIVTLQFSIPGPRFDEAEREEFSAWGQWVVVNERGARLFVDAVGPEENLQAALDALDAMGRSAKVIGVWQMDGTRHPDYPINHAEFVRVAPDRYDAEGNVLPRPTEFAEVHGWFGWAAKQ